MRRLVTGVDGDGRSCLVEAGDLAFGGDGAPGVRMGMLFATGESPPPARPPGRGDFLDLGVAPGRASWLIIEWEPGAAFGMHHTDTIDFDVVLEGSVELTLDDGAHELGPGDCVVMTGVDHAWRAGPDGCRLSVLALGTPPPA